MLFTSAGFAFLYLPVVFAGFFLIGRRSEWLAAAWLLLVWQMQKLCASSSMISPRAMNPDLVGIPAWSNWDRGMAMLLKWCSWSWSKVSL